MLSRDPPAGLRRRGALDRWPTLGGEPSHHLSRALPVHRETHQLGGWVAQDGSGHDPDGPARPWSSALEARSVPIGIPES